MSENTIIKGIIAIADKIRGEAKSVVDDIKRFKIEPVILTGDTEPSARFVGSTLGIKNIKASLLPQDKAEEIEKLKQKYRYVADRKSVV